MDKSIRKSLRAALDQQGLSQQDVADRLGISRQAVNNVLSGQRGLLPKSLTDIVAAAGGRLVFVADADG